MTQTLNTTGTTVGPRAGLHPQKALWKTICKLFDEYDEHATTRPVDDCAGDLDVIQALLEIYAKNADTQSNVEWARKLLAKRETELMFEPPVIQTWRLENQHINTVTRHTWTTIQTYTDFLTARRALRNATHDLYRYRLSGAVDL